MDYVVGFMICPQTNEVLFIEKQRPAFQKGKWNGVGGKIEPNEKPIDAMVREFREETGVTTQTHQWEHTATTHGGSDRDMDRQPFTIYVYRSIVDEFPDFKQTTDERLQIFPMKRVFSDFDGKGPIPTLSNMKFLLPLQFSFQVQFPIDFPQLERN
jgi:8-oxo-dGTP diphosphatase